MLEKSGKNVPTIFEKAWTIIVASPGFAKTSNESVFLGKKMRMDSVEALQAPGDPQNESTWGVKGSGVCRCGGERGVDH